MSCPLQPTAPPAAEHASAARPSTQARYCLSLRWHSISRRAQSRDAVVARLGPEADPRARTGSVVPAEGVRSGVAQCAALGVTEARDRAGTLLTYRRCATGREAGGRRDKAGGIERPTTRIGLRAHAADATIERDRLAKVASIAREIAQALVDQRLLGCFRMVESIATDLPVIAGVTEAAERVLELDGRRRQRGSLFRFDATAAAGDHKCEDQAADPWRCAHERVA